jgi:hypothetical protein
MLATLTLNVQSLEGMWKEVAISDLNISALYLRDQKYHSL